MAAGRQRSIGAVLTVAPYLGASIAGLLRLPLDLKTTVTVNDAAAPLPRLSVAVQLTVVVRTGKTMPDAGLQAEATGPSTTSDALVVYATALPERLVVETRCAGGTVITGG